MTPKEKAKELIDKMYNIDFFDDYNEIIKKSALIAADELIYSHSQDTTDNQFYYWQEVKQEIEKL